MDELLELQRTLAAVQLEDTKFRLSERNCIEIVMKLKEIGIVELIYTSNGKEYLTPNQLKSEIEDELLANGGRVHLSEIQPVINVDMLQIEWAATKCTEEDAEISLLAGELIAEWYLDKLCQEINEELKGGDGQYTIGQLASRYNLPAPFVTSMIEKRLGTVLKANFKRGLLFTDAFDRKQMAKIRGILTAVTRPISISQIASFYGFEDGVVEDAVKTLNQEGKVAGNLRGREWIPTVFSKAQRACVEVFFSQNGYFELSRAKALQIQKPLQFLKQIFPDAEELHDTIVSHSLTENLVANFEEAVRMRSWTEAGAYLPSSLSASDVGLLLNKIAKTHKGEVTVLAEQYLVSQGFLDDCIQSFKQAAEETAQVVAREKKPSTGKSISTISPLEEDFIVVDADQEEPSNSKKMGKANKRAAKYGSRKQKDESDDDEEESSRSATKKKKDKRKNKQLSSSSSSTKPKEVCQQYITVDQVEEKLLVFRPELEEFAEFTSVLAEELLRPIQALYEECVTAALSEVLQGDSAERRKRQRVFEQEWEEPHMTLQLLLKGYQVLVAEQCEEELRAACEEHIISSYCLPFAEFITKHICFLNQISFRKSKCGYETNGHSGDKCAVTDISAEEKAQLQEELEKDVWQTVKGLWDSVSQKKSFERFMDILETSALLLCDVFPRKLDKKKERQSVFIKKQELLSQLDESGFNLSTFRIVILLLFQQTHNSILSLPECFTSLNLCFSFLKSSMSETTLEVLTIFETFMLQSAEEHSTSEITLVPLSCEEQNVLLQKVKKIAGNKKEA